MRASRASRVEPLPPALYAGCKNTRYAMFGLPKHGVVGVVIHLSSVCAWGGDAPAAGFDLGTAAFLRMEVVLQVTPYNEQFEHEGFNMSHLSFFLKQVSHD